MTDRKKAIEEAAKRLPDVIRYVAASGLLYSRATGKPYLSEDVHGYIRLFAFGRKWKAHRVIWFLEKGTHPDIVDHIDGDRTNNHISNLREASFKQNAYNCTIKSTTSKYKGVWKAKTGRYRASLTKDAKRIHLGYFATPEEAARAYNEALRKEDPRARLNIIEGDNL